MADVTQVSFVESDSHHEVVFQKGRDVVDYELNELGDLLRVLIYRSLQASSGDGWATGCRITATGGSNEVQVGLGILSVDGLTYRRASNTTLAMPAPPGSGSRVDTIYLRVQESEIDDPHPLASVGVLSRRKRVSFAFVVAQGSTLSSTGDPWSGGTYYLSLAEVTRTSGAAIILTGDIVHQVRPNPQAITTQITAVSDGRASAVNGGTGGVFETDLRTLTLDTAEGSTTDLSEVVRFRFNRDSIDQKDVWTFDVTGKVTVVGDLQFDDARVSSPVRLGDSTDAAGASLRSPFGANAYNVTVNQSGSIVRSLNGRFSATVGDGTTTFGDFNGSLGISALLAAATAAGMNSVFIHLKEGSFPTLGADFSAFDEVIIEGEGATSTFISNGHASNPSLTVNRLALRNLSMDRSSTATVAVVADSVFAENVRFTNLGVSTSASSETASIFENCRFIAPSATPCVNFGANTSMAVEFSRCSFTGASGYPVVSGGADGPKTLTFRECSITYGAFTGATSDSGVIAPSTTITVGTWWTCFENCRFTQPAAEASVHMNDLLENLTYRGCKFLFTSNNATLPFAYFSAATLCVENCVFDTQDFVSGVDADEGQAIILQATQLMCVRSVSFRRSNTRLFPGTVVSTGCLACINISLKGCHAVVEGVEFDYRSATATGTDTVPRQLLYVGGDASVGRPSIDLSGVKIVRDTGAIAYCTQAAVRLAGTFENAVVRSCSLRFGNVAQIPAGAAAIMLGGPSGDDITGGGQVTVRDCFIQNCNGGGVSDLNTAATVNHVDCCTFITVGQSGTDPCVGASGPIPGYLHVTNCKIDTSGSVGIAVTRDVAVVRGNNIRNAHTGGTPGARWYVYFGVSSTLISWVCMDNICLDASGSSEGIRSPSISLDRAVMKGFDTMYDSTATEVFTLGEFEDGEAMQFNVATLVLI
jgi:hypothetical protein